MRKVVKIGAAIAAGIISLLLMGVAWPIQATADPDAPRTTPKVHPYPDPSTGGVGTWTPRVP